MYLTILILRCHMCDSVSLEFRRIPMRGTPHILDFRGFVDFLRYCD